ncbi:MAG: hypothetical protein OEM41_09960 [Ignavibacteria bacterium]|nr:hypothetical protein [Ignavibacteria bacterium]
MKKRYRFAQLSKDEKEYLEMVLMEEIEIQSWYFVAYISMFSEELIMTVQ